jgi:hypothetical protein
MTTLVERTRGHYEVQRTSYGQAYVWCPECVVVECDCGERVVLTASESVCRCGADHAALAPGNGVSPRQADEVPHPWDAEYRDWKKKQDEYLRSELDHWLEWTVIE